MLGNISKIIEVVMEYSNEDYYEVINMPFNEIIERYYKATDFQEIKEYESDYKVFYNHDHIEFENENDYSEVVSYVTKLKLHPRKAIDLRNQVIDSMIEVGYDPHDPFGERPYDRRNYWD
ncbi:hypothetical protein JNUCC23_09510 [Peribacillus sp. JNUCC 23]